MGRLVTNQAANHPMPWRADAQRTDKKFLKKSHGNISVAF